MREGEKEREGEREESRKRRVGCEATVARLREKGDKQTDRQRQTDSARGGGAGWEKESEMKRQEVHLASFDDVETARKLDLRAQRERQTCRQTDWHTEAGRERESEKEREGERESRR